MGLTIPVSVTLPKLYTFLVVYMPFILHNSIKDSRSTFVAMKIIWWNESMRESFSNTQLDKNIRLRVATTTSNDKSKNCIESFLVNTWNRILLPLPFTSTFFIFLIHTNILFHTYCFCISAWDHDHEVRYFKFEWI